MNKNVTTNSQILPFELWEIIFSILFSQVVVDNGGKKGKYHLLAFCAANGIDRHIRAATTKLRMLEMTSMDTASAKGNLDLLNWWVVNIPSNKLQNFYTVDAIKLAAENNKVISLDWWKNSHLVVKYDIEASLEAATRMGCKNVLEWWKKNELPFKFKQSPMDIAHKCDNWEMVRWWLLESGEPMVFSFSPLLLQSH